jgi:hypothetical protein
LLPKSSVRKVTPAALFFFFFSLVEVVIFLTERTTIQESAVTRTFSVNLCLALIGTYCWTPSKRESPSRPSK